MINMNVKTGLFQKVIKIRYFNFYVNAEQMQMLKYLNFFQDIFFPTASIDSHSSALLNEAA